MHRSRLQGRVEEGGGAEEEKEERDRTGKQEMEGRGEGVLREGSQSNYRQRRSPGFFGDT